MKFSFFGLEHSLVVSSNQVTVVEVLLPRMFTRMCAAFLQLNQGEFIESFCVFNERDEEISPADAYLPVFNPFDLPWGDRGLAKGFIQRFDRLLREDEGRYSEILTLVEEISNHLSECSLELQGMYNFESDVAIESLLKFYNFKPDRDIAESHIDNLIRFLQYVSDSHCGKALVFFDFKKFFNEDELDLLYEQAFFYQIPIIMLESVKDERSFVRERKLLIDQDLLEYISCS